jgi:hypothetical protein
MGEKGKAKPSKGLELTDVRNQRDINCIMFDYAPPKGYSFDGIEMFPARLSVRVKKRPYFVPEEADRDG